MKLSGGAPDIIDLGRKKLIISKINEIERIFSISERYVSKPASLMDRFLLKPVKNNRINDRKVNNDKMNLRINAPNESYCSRRRKKESKITFRSMEDKATIQRTLFCNPVKSISVILFIVLS